MDNSRELHIFAQNIQYIRKLHNLTQKQMATLLGISVQSLRNIEQGPIPPRLHFGILLKVYQEFQISSSKIISQMKDPSNKMMKLTKTHSTKASPV